jgi:hypothetical protein
MEKMAPFNKRELFPTTGSSTMLCLLAIEAEPQLLKLYSVAGNSTSTHSNNETENDGFACYFAQSFKKITFQSKCPTFQHITDKIPVT